MGWIKPIFITLALGSTAWGQALVDRQAEHQAARQEFLATHFFENGRGMTISPDLSIFFGGLKKAPSIIQDPIIIKRYGFLPGEKQRFVGVYDVKYKDIDLAVLGCTACHSGRAAGILIPGLGNKTIDPFMIGKDLLKIQKIWGEVIADKINNNEDYAYIHEKALNFAKMLADERISNLTRGLVPDSVIKTFFYRDMGVEYGPEIGHTHVKVPSLWGIGEKIKVGVFADGSLSSKNYAWVFGAEMAASDSAEHLRASLPKVRHLVDNVLAKLLPPKYPYNINQDRAQAGKVLFENNCVKCHGQHKRDPEGFPIYNAPELVPHDLVGTDPQRLDYGEQLWVDLAAQGSLKDLIKFNHHLFGYGYFAPKLWGIWSRFPYLHNGSVPTLHHLLMSPEDRPKVFSMEDAGEVHRFDSEWVGLTTFNNPVEYKTQLLEAEWGDRNLYWTDRVEHSNQGHYFEFIESFDDQDKENLIEFLKTL